MSENDFIGKELGFVEDTRQDKEQPQLHRVELKATPITHTEDKEIKSFVQQDYEDARDFMMEALKTGSEFMKNATAVAQARNDPESMQAASGAIKAQTDAAEKFLRLSETHKKVTNTNVHGETKSVTNQIFVGSTADLDKMVKDAEKRKNYTDAAIEEVPHNVIEYDDIPKS